MHQTLSSHTNYLVPLSIESIEFYNRFSNNSDSNDRVIIDLKFKTPIIYQMLNNSIKRFISNYIVFNSHIENINNKLYWVKNKKIFNSEFFDINSLTDEKNKVFDDIYHELVKPFQLQWGPLYRFISIRYENDKYHLIIVLHKIIIDEVLLNTFINEFLNYYNNELYTNNISIEKQLCALTNLSINSLKLYKYNDQQNIFNENLISQERNQNLESLDFSFLVLKNKKTNINGKYLFKDNKQKFRYFLSFLLSKNSINNVGEKRFYFSNKVLIKLKNLYFKYKISTSDYSLSIYALLLNKHSGQNKFYIKYYLSESHLFNKNNLILGARKFLNIRTIPYDFGKIKNVIDIINQSKINNNIDITNEIPTAYNSILDESILNIEFFENIFDVDPIKHNNRNCNFENINVYSQNMTNAFYHLSLIQQSIGSKKINFIIKYKIKDVDKFLLEQFIKCYKRLFIQILTEILESKIHFSQLKSLNIQTIRLLSDIQYKKMINTWNQKDKFFLHKKTIHRLFEEQVKKTPDSIAVVYKDIYLTYLELNNKANQLARYIIQINSIKSDNLIALFLERNEYMLIAILGVLKAGGAYVPIDPMFPDTRINYILNDINSNILLTNEIHKKRLINIDQKINCISIDNNKLSSKLNQQPVTNLDHHTTSNHLAYIMYTSGTTGTPNGVMIEHIGVINTVTFLKNVYDFTKGNKTSAFTSYVFDVSVSEFFTTLLQGGELHLLSNRVREDPILISKYIINKKINYIYLPPALLSILPRINYPSLYGIIYAGESCNKDTGIYWSSNYKLHNYYGPTETTIYTSGRHIVDKNINLIGIPLPNTKVYVLNNELNPLPIGVVGELYIGGVGLARGYLNRADLTAERFIANPFNLYNIISYPTFCKKKNNTRLYKTGDLVRWLPNGNLEYIGRNDLQIKIRGYRIEPGEIENILMTYNGIKQCLVIAKEFKTQLEIKINNTDEIPNNKYLVAYYIRAANKKNKDNEGLDFINKLHAIYQTKYSSLNISNFKESTNVWISSYDGRAMTKEDMNEWVNETVKRIKDLKPNIILEIGSGSGLVLFNVIDNCNYYYASDFSSNAINYTNKLISKLSYKNKITTFCCSADSIPYESIKKSYDLVIINGVIMHFPSLYYLESVIINAILHMQDDGKIFIGDVRDYRLLKCFHYSIQHYKNKKVNKVEIDYYSKRDKDLLVSPEYFIDLQTRNKDISHVEVMPRLGKCLNEMNNYRYDVIIYVNKIKNNNKDLNILTCVNEKHITTVFNFAKYFQQNIGNSTNIDNEPNYFCIRYPNKRILKNYAEYINLYNNEKIVEKDYADRILYIDQILKTIKNKGLSAKFLLDIHNPIYFYIVIYKIGLNKNISIKYNLNNSRSYISTDYNESMANNPSSNLSMLNDSFAIRIKEYLINKLPIHMVPEYYIQLDRFPLSVNGKIDIKALPEPEFINLDNYAPPRNELEISLSKIWSKVLGLPENKIGIYDSFFGLGGNSILAISVANIIKSELEINIDILDIFKYRTIDKLSMYVESTLSRKIKGKEYVF